MGSFPVSLPVDLVMDSSAVGSSLNNALGSNVTAVDSSTDNSTGGAQLTSYNLTTAAVDNNTVTLSGKPSRAVLLTRLSCAAHSAIAVKLTCLHEQHCNLCWLLCAELPFA